MKRKHRLREQLTLEIIERKNRTTVNIIDRGKTIQLAKVKTSEYFFCKVKLHSNYLVVYTRGCMVNNIPLVIEAAYSVATRETVNLESEKTRTLIEYMVVSRQAFDMAEVLQTINKNNLEIVEQDKKEELKKYLTANTTCFTDDEVRMHILKHYPWLAAYTNLAGPISVIEYRKLLKDLESRVGRGYFSFYIMPLQPSCFENADISFEKPNNVDYRNIYLSEVDEEKRQ